MTLVLFGRRLVAATINGKYECNKTWVETELFQDDTEFDQRTKTFWIIHTVARMWRLYKTGIGLTTGFIGSHTVTHNYSVYTLTAHYSLS
jgi:hypothetical protein